MTSFFSDLTHVTYFSYGFSFLEEYGEDLNLEDIAEEIQDLVDEYPENRDIPLALDSLYMAMGDVDSAIDALLNDFFLSEFSTFQLRYADHLLLKGDTEEAEKVLNKVILMDNPDSIVRQLCALIAFGILGNETEFKRRWNRLKKESKSNPFSFETFLDSMGGSTSLLADLPFKEQIKGIYLLKKFNVTKNLEDEAFDLIANLDSYLKNLYNMYICELRDEGVIENYPGFSIAEKICLKAIETANKFYQMEGVIKNPDYRKSALTAINSMISIGETFKLAEALTKTLIINKNFFDDILSIIVPIADNDSMKVKETLYLFSREDLTEEGRKFIWSHLDMTPEQAQKVFGDVEYDEIGEEDEDIDENKEITDDEDSLGYTEVIDPEREKENSITPRYQTVLNEDEAQEDLTWLISRLNQGKRVMKTDSLLALSIRLKRVDEIIPFIPIFEEYANYDLVYTLKGYQKMQQKDIKGALQMLDKVHSYGLPDGEIDLYTAILMNITAYPKRAVGICEKLLKKKGYNAEVVYPVLIEGLKLLGRDKEAETVRLNTCQ